MVVPPLDLYGPIAADLEEVERILARVLRSRYDAVSEVVDHVRHYRGKRLRPVLLLLTARACGRVTPAHHVLGAVVEMIHTATLVHDDVLDSASVRRHVPTVNARWGNQTSVLLGDYLFTHAFHLASTLDDVRACRLIGEATNRVCEGELCQGLQRGNLDLTEEEYFDIIDGKTAELIACCCQLGALFSGASAEVVNSLTRFGRWVGHGVPDRRRPARPGRRGAGDRQVAGHRPGTAEDDAAVDPSAGASPAGPGRARAADPALPATDKRELLRPCLAESDGLDYAHAAPRSWPGGRKELSCLPPSPCRSILEAITERVVHRNS